MTREFLLRRTFVRICLALAIAAPLAGVTAVKVHAQSQLEDGSGCSCDCGGGAAICKTVICSDGTSTTCNREKQTSPPSQPTD